MTPTNAPDAPLLQVGAITRSFGGFIALDNISVVVRHTLVQLLTPDVMRGRVSAVNNIFIGSSNELGAFESGLVEAYFGPVFSVVSGGIGTVLVVGLVMAKWPQVLRIGSLETVKAAPVSTA